MSEQENTEQTQEEDVEAHARRKRFAANDEAPSDEAEETDDVEAHLSRKKFT